MAKEKKITIKHYLNKRLKAKIKDGEEFYPPYVQITYDRENTQFYMDWMPFFLVEPFFNRFSEESFKAIFNPKDKLARRQVKTINDIIKGALRFELEKYKDKFTLKGFGKRLTSYRDDFIYSYKDELEGVLLDFLKLELSTERYMKLMDKILKKMSDNLVLNINKKYLSKIKDELPNELLIKMQTYFLLEAFSDKYENVEYYYEWLFFDAIKDFEDFFQKKAYLKKSNAFRTELKEFIPIDNFEIYRQEIEDFISKKFQAITIQF